MSDDTRDLQIIISTEVEKAIQKFGGSDDFHFHFGLATIPTPEGVVCAGALNVFLPNPLLGTGDMVATMIVQDISQLRHVEAIEELVQQAVKNLRDKRSEVIGQSNGHASPGGLIVP